MQNNLSLNITFVHISLLNLEKGNNLFLNVLSNCPGSCYFKMYDLYRNKSHYSYAATKTYNIFLRI